MVPTLWNLNIYTHQSIRYNPQQFFNVNRIKKWNGCKRINTQSRRRILTTLLEFCNCVCEHMLYALVRRSRPCIKCISLCVFVYVLVVLLHKNTEGSKANAKSNVCSKHKINMVFSMIRRVIFLLQRCYFLVVHLPYVTLLL